MIYLLKAIVTRNMTQTRRLHGSIDGGLSYVGFGCYMEPLSSTAALKAECHIEIFGRGQPRRSGDAMRASVWSGKGGRTARQQATPRPARSVRAQSGYCLQTKQNFIRSSVALLNTFLYALPVTVSGRSGEAVNGTSQDSVNETIRNQQWCTTAPTHHSTVTDFARFLGLSISVPLASAA